MTIVITTINGRQHGSIPTWQRLCDERGWTLITVGDRDGSQDVSLPWAEQERRWPELSRLIRARTYARKNFGYLAAPRGEQVYETDDDNWPLEDWELPPLETDLVLEGPSFNPGLDAFVARGYPLPWVQPFEKPRLDPYSQTCRALVSQHWCEGEPDRWAHERSWPLQSPNGSWGDPLLCPPGCWTPFNSQMTLWRERCVEMFIPAGCPMRCTDIYRGWWAQRSGWERGLGVIHAGPGVRQDRNVHDLEADIASEVPMLVDGTKQLRALKDCTTHAQCVDAFIAKGWVTSSQLRARDLFEEAL